jgi:hypothetical protein
MRTEPLNSWSDFAGKISSVENEFGYHDAAGKRQKNRILFRGQSNAKWELETTLERYSRKEWSVESYVELLQRLKPQVESFSNQLWTFPRSNNWAEGNRLPCHELWVYLRHCGFPSPLLDWTISPFVALFFAFENFIEADEVAIYAYIDAPLGTKSYWAKDSHIYPVGVHEKTHPRHFLQQSFYTICIKSDQNSHIFTRHGDVFRDTARNSNRQDALIKITVPQNNRKSALQELDKMNINSFSLFQSEEALMKTLAFREIDLTSNPLSNPLPELGSSE